MTIDSSASPTTVTIPGLGSVQGSIKNGIASFLNVPFGSIPERWRQAVPAQPWEGLRDATVQGPMCPQQNSPFLMDRLLNHSESFTAAGTRLTFDEKNCLNLNIYVPESVLLETENKSVPVMVWVHGGSLRTGGNGLALYDGSNLVQRSVELNDPIILVSMNYRLHYFGFMSSQELVEDLAQDPTIDSSSELNRVVGNWGFSDQKLGFEWVRQYISAFGGNGRDVTAFAESAGAVSLGYHLTTKAHHGLFDKVILQSGSTVTMPAGTVAHGQHYFDHLCQVHGVDLGLSGPEKLKALRAVPADVMAQELTSSALQMFTPSLDGNLIQRDVRTLIVDPSVYDPKIVRVLAGTCKDEGTLFAATFGGPTLEKWAVLRDRLTGKDQDQKDLFDKIYGVPEIDLQALLASSQVIGDAIFQYPTFASAAAIEKQKVSENRKDLASPHWPRVTRYQWDRPLEAISKLGLPLGVHHAVELPFLFGSQTALDYFTEQESELSKHIQEIWIRFATGSAHAGPVLETPENESILFGNDCKISATKRLRLSDDKMKLWNGVNKFVQDQIAAGNTSVGFPTHHILP